MNAKRNILRAARLLAVSCLFLAVAASTASAQTEDGIKAAFLYNYAKYTEWPAKAFADGNAPITVGFIGADSLADTFEKNITGKNVGGRDFSVKKLTDAAGAEGCQIIFIGDPGKATAVLGSLKGKPVLTVGDNDQFVGSGGMIRFVKDGAKVSFDLNLDATNAAELKLDQKLRQIAKSVKGG